jgi:hypothetical protein
MNFRGIHRSSSAHERRLIEQPGCLQVENQVIVLGDPLEGVSVVGDFGHQPPRVRNLAEIAATPPTPTRTTMKADSWKKQ